MSSYFLHDAIKRVELVAQISDDQSCVNGQIGTLKLVFQNLQKCSFKLRLVWNSKTEIIKSLFEHVLTRFAFIAKKLQE